MFIRLIIFCILSVNLNLVAQTHVGGVDNPANRSSDTEGLAREFMDRQLDKYKLTEIQVEEFFLLNIYNKRNLKCHPQAKKIESIVELAVKLRIEKLDHLKKLQNGSACNKADEKPILNQHEHNYCKVWDKELLAKFEKFINKEKMILYLSVKYKLGVEDIDGVIITIKEFVGELD